MSKIFEQCTVDGELTPELIKRKKELDTAMEAELTEIEAGRGQQWVAKERQYADVRQRYADIWEQELADAGYVVRPIFESTENWYDTLSTLNEAQFVKEASSKKLPTPPATIEIVNIEPRIQKPYDNRTEHFRHYDVITYIDPISGRTETATVWEEREAFGNWFGWGSKHNRHWDYAAYSYEGKLLPDVDPTGHMSAAHKKALERTVSEINN